MFPFGSMLTADPLEVVSLQGSSGSPVTRNEVGFSESSETYHIILAISALDGGNSISRGYIEYDGYKEGDAVVYQPIHIWVTPTDFVNGPYYVRATLDADTAPDAGTLNSWLTLAKDTNVHFWRWSHNGPIARGGTLKIEICTVGDGSNIIATGYYRCTVSVTP